MKIELFYNPHQGARTLHAANAAMAKQLRGLKATSLGHIDVPRPISKTTYITSLGDVDAIHPDKLEALKDPLQWMLDNTIKVSPATCHSDLMARVMLGYELIPVQLHLATTTHDANVLYASAHGTELRQVGNDVFYEGELRATRVRKLVKCGISELPRLLLDRETPVCGIADERPRVRWRLSKRS